MKVQREFIPGDEWLYFKLYTGVKTADTILLEVIKPISEKFLQARLIDKWFFIRYADPDFHLRVRFCMIDKTKIGQLILELNSRIKPFVENNLVSLVQIDTYSRELERYGKSTINLVENLFFVDSKTTLGMLDLIEGDEGEIYRWHFGCMATDSLLSDFDYPIIQKLELFDKLQYGFGQEFNMDNNLKVQLDKIFRNERQKIRDLLLRKDEFYESFYQILDQKTNESFNIVKEIKALQEKNKLEVNIDDLLGSCIHMMLNRIFKSKQRLNEMVVYSLLFRFYRSELARNRKQ
jgi:thiopeptide-type bacteriocin biosynthesis protein